MKKLVGTELLFMARVRQFTGSHVLWVVINATFRRSQSSAASVYKDTPSTHFQEGNSA